MAVDIIVCSETPTIFCVYDSTEYVRRELKVNKDCEAFEKYSSISSIDTLNNYENKTKAVEKTSQHRTTKGPNPTPYLMPLLLDYLRVLPLIFRPPLLLGNH